MTLSFNSKKEFNQKLLQLWKDLRPKKEEVKLQSQYFNLVSLCYRTLFGDRTNLLPVLHGSVAYGIENSHSDLDISIPNIDMETGALIDKSKPIHRSLDVKKQCQSILAKMVLQLHTHKAFTNLQYDITFIKDAKCPIIQIKDRSGIEIDLNAEYILKKGFNKPICVLFKELITRLVNFHETPKIKQFICIIKHLMNVKGISGAKQNFPSGISYTVLCLKYLQHAKILPLISSTGKIIQNSEIKCCSFTLYDLIKGFFEYFLQIDWEKTQVSIMNAGQVEKKTFHHSKYAMLVKCPFERGVNLSRHVNKSTLLTVISQMKVLLSSIKKKDFDLLVKTNKPQTKRPHKQQKHFKRKSKGNSVPLFIPRKRLKFQLSLDDQMVINLKISHVNKKRRFQQNRFVKFPQKVPQWPDYWRSRTKNNSKGK